MSTLDPPARPYLTPLFAAGLALWAACAAVFSAAQTVSDQTCFAIGAACAVGAFAALAAALKNGTPMGLQAKAYIEAGKLVPDDVVIGIIKDRLAEDDCKNGFILDGFPRTIPQAEALDEMGIVIDRVIDIEVADEKIAKRMSGRRVCKACGNSYHLEYKKPAVDGVCDDCGGELV